MADPTASPDAGADVGPARTSDAGYPGTPRWVKLSGIVVLILVLLVVGAMVALGGQHGPGRHLPAGAPGGPGSETASAAWPGAAGVTLP